MKPKSAATPHAGGRLQPDVMGILLAAGNTPMVIHGAFRVRDADVEGLPSPAVKSLVVVLQRLHESPRQMHRAVSAIFTPFKEVVVFQDDQRRSHDVVEGGFTVDLSRELPRADGAGARYCVFASLGVHTSNTLDLTVNA
ncbi:MAG: hypothetical protein U0271_27740 [Polyangiaceae bacterium]